MRRPLVFVTDYGRDDAYAAALTGAALAMDPDLRCIDGTHGVPPGDVLAAGYHVKSLALAFRDAVICAVVDPGVGTERRAIAMEAGGRLYVAPDNGLLSYQWCEAVPAELTAVELRIPRNASATFHGRDVFAPAAAALAMGAPLGSMGAPLDDPVIAPGAFATRDGCTVGGRVIVIDHFGNAITTIRASDIGVASVTGVRWAGGSTERMVRTYEEVGEGLAALIGSAGHLEISARGRPARDAGGPALHAEVTVSLDRPA